MNPPPRHLGVLRIELDQHVVAVELRRDQAHGAGARERVEHGAGYGLAAVVAGGAEAEGSRCYVASAIYTVAPCAIPTRALRQFSAMAVKVWPDGNAAPLHDSHPRRAALGAAAALAGASADATLRQRLGKSCEVRLGEGLRRDGPDRAGVAMASRYRRRSSMRVLSDKWVIPNSGKTTSAPDSNRIYTRLPHRLRIVEVPRRLRQQKHVLVRLRRPVSHALGHGVGLVPDDVRAQVPAIRL